VSTVSFEHEGSPETCQFRETIARLSAMRPICAPDSFEWISAMQQHDVKQTAALEERLAQHSKSLLQQAETLLPGPERDELLRQAKLSEIAAKMQEWLSLPELQPPR
jgi:hypothetical protein